ncbi:hypothetical protein [Kitasatospora phosalacinea]|uniref:hypothetical protein n=1 Tax=Kitasatospora phosalacinea TaxID=2065 RepID=UPI000ACDF68C
MTSKAAAHPETDSPVLVLIAPPALRSAGAGQDVATARRRGRPVYHDVAELPGRARREEA